MTTQGFEVIVGAPNSVEDEQIAIAEASCYLAYADTTDSYGYHGDTIDVTVYGDDAPYAIGIQFVTVIENDDELKRFMDEMATLSRVESVERLSYVVE